MSTNDELKNETANGTKPVLPAVIRLQEINKKNEQKKEYSLGDVMLLDKYENELFARGYSREYIESLSPSYYGS